VSRAARPRPHPGRAHGERAHAFERLFRRHQAAVAAYAARRTTAAAVDDVVAETFAVAWRRFDDIPADPLPWLFGVARRVLSTQRRGERRRDALVDRLAAERAGAPGPPPLLDDALEAALSRLSERDREVLRLVAWEDLTTARAAAAMGCTHAALRVRLHRARRRLAAALAELDEPLPERTVQRSPS
jgi:RNA polymerase sigma-70 factor, ECF subfamily